MKHLSSFKASLAGGLAATFIGHAAHAGSTPIGDPTYAWYLRETREFVVAPGQWDFHDFLVASGGQPGGTLARTWALGPTLFGTTALDAVAAYDDGHTFWASAQSPLLGGPGRDVVGGQAEIAIAQSYRKDSPDASLSFSFSGAQLRLANFGSGRGDGYGVYAYVSFSAIVVAHDSAELVWSEGQSAWLYQDFNLLHDQSDNRWALTLGQEREPTSSGMPAWQWSCDACGRPDSGFVTAALDAPFTGTVDLADIELGSEFTVGFRLVTVALDYAQGETGASALARDPTGGAGIGFSFEGLTATDRPISVSAVPEPPVTLLLAVGLAMLAWLGRRRPSGAIRTRSASRSRAPAPPR
jgi:uncharacterized protein (TIGR03382 family)